MDQTQPVAGDPVQEHYAAAVQWLVTVGFALLVAAFVLYVTGAARSAVPVNTVPSIWHLSAEEFVREVGADSGWGWVRKIGQGQNLSLAALVLFPAGTIGVVLIASLLYLRRRDFWYAAIASLEAAVLVSAATGVLSRIR